METTGRSKEVRLPAPGGRTDTEIANAAVNALRWHSTLPPGTVRVAVEQGILTLRGEVDWPDLKGSAENAVRHVRGVRGIVNELTVRPRLAPEEICRHVAKALERSAAAAAARERIRVEVDEGRVVLRGTVDSPVQRSEAGWAAWSAPGVSEVENDLEVRAPPAPPSAGT